MTAALVRDYGRARPGVPTVIYAARCDLCRRVFTTSRPSWADRRAYYMSHLRWKHSVGRSKRAISMLADEFMRREKEMGVV